MFESALYANYEQEKQWLVMSEGSPTKLLSILGGKCEGSLLNRRKQGVNWRTPLKVYKQLDSFGSNYYFFRWLTKFIIWYLKCSFMFVGWEDVL